ncbi:hypothetical protein GWK47_047295 [Chionoecetes opilio]|uniref:Uncharacterized protein n=1 Tax=Chionoecetes opilio TaxID=41210 RepID=A0A8J5CGE7_CHIOP|nr:hypothetical protein GWK47_047295 [Chionoecetes opilio]
MGGSASTACNQWCQAAQLEGPPGNNCPRYSAQRAISPSMSDTRRPSAFQIALAQEGDFGTELFRARPTRAHMATDTPERKNPPVASRYCYCVCDKRDLNTLECAAGCSRKMLEGVCQEPLLPSSMGASPQQHQ